MKDTEATRLLKRKPFRIEGRKEEQEKEIGEYASRAQAQSNSVIVRRIVRSRQGSRELWAVNK